MINALVAVRLEQWVFIVAAVVGVWSVFLSPGREATRADEAELENAADPWGNPADNDPPT